MAQSGGNKKTSSKLQQAHYKQYRLENRAQKNKIKKLERHCKRFPNDEQGKINLARIKKDGYNPRKKPLVPGSNPTTARNPMKGFIHHPKPKTAGEQLAELLGRAIPRHYKPRRKKTSVSYKKKRRNVKA